MAQVKLKGKEIHTNGNLPSVGSQAFDFVLIDNELKEKSLKDFKGKKKVISIVPSLDTAVCSLSMKKFHEALGSRSDVALIIVSADSPFAQKRVCGQEDTPNLTTLSIVRSKEFPQQYGVLIEDGPLKGFCARAVLVLDENDKIVYTELVPEITQEPNYDKALAAL